MDYGKLGLFAGISERMRYLAERQSLIAQNIANANTPEYRAQDLKPVDFSNVLAKENGKLQMAATQAGHLQPASTSGRFDKMEKRDGFETTISGNNVVMEEEMKKMSDTSLNYQETTALYKKMTDIMRLATGNR